MTVLQAPPAVFSREEAAHYLGMSLSLLDELIRRGKLYAKRDPEIRRVFIPRKSCDDYLFKKESEE